MSCMLDINIKGVTYNAGEKATAYDMVKEDVAAKIRQARPPPPEPVVAFQPATQAPVAQREVNFLQHLLAQNQPEEDVIDVPMEDVVLEATRELNIYRAYPRMGHFPQMKTTFGGQNTTYLTFELLQESIWPFQWGKQMLSESFLKQE